MRDSFARLMIELESTDYMLVVEQREVIPLERVQPVAAQTGERQA